MRNVCSSFGTEDMETTIWKTMTLNGRFLEFRSPNCTYTVVVCFFSPSVKNMKDNRLFLSPSSEENDVAFRLLVIIFPAFTIFCAVFFLFLFFFLT